MCQLLGRIRKVINQTELPEPKKAAIYDKISALQAEVDKSTTRFDALLSRWLDLTNALGEGAENLEPLVKLMERLRGVFGRAKAAHDQGQLPAPEEQKQLPGPEPAVADELDDEIAF